MRLGLVVISLVAATTVFVMRLLSVPDPPGMGGSAEVAGPVPWVVLEVGADRRSLTIIPLADRSECGFPWGEVAKVPNPTIQLRASIRRQGCGAESLVAMTPTPVTVPVPGPKGVAGQRVDGPRFRGAATTEYVLQARAWQGRAAYPNVQGLRVALAAQILEANGATFEAEIVGPVTETAYVWQQWPAPGTTIKRGEPQRPPSSSNASSLPALKRALLLTSDPKSNDQRDRDYSFSCRQAKRLTAEERQRYVRLVPASCD